MSMKQNTGSCAFEFSRMVMSFLILTICCSVSLCFTKSVAAKGNNYEIVVHDGKVEKTIEYFKSKKFWGANDHEKDLDVPRIVVAVISKRWGKEAQKIPVAVKKELFYRSIVPLILLANELILDERQDIIAIREQLSNLKKLSIKEEERLKELSLKYGVQDVAPQKKQLTQLLKRADTIPPSLALGQAAYESGYGTSRFATEGNAFFGQWTFNGDGMKPQEHRVSKGNYGVAAYDWPFDSVRSYMQNLNTHNAYKKLRTKRSTLRQQGQEATGLLLAETLDKYSEMGMEYVKTLKSIINVNGLAIADNMHLRDESTTLLVGVGQVDKVEEAEQKIEELRKSGELERIIKSMHLTND